MPTTFQPCDEYVAEMALGVMRRYDNHKPLLDAKVKIDFVFALGACDEDGKRIADAIVKRGRVVLGQTRVVNLKDRAKGMGDAEIVLDGDRWPAFSEDEAQAILDHELCHIGVKTDRHGNAKTDDLQRPMLKLREHDFEAGWFTIVAERHGRASQERQQAKQLFDEHGQSYWPGLFNQQEVGPTRVSNLELVNA
jgi:hypothetical protein